MSETVNDIRAAAVADIAAMFSNEAPQEVVAEEESEIPDGAEPEGEAAEPDAEASGEEVTDEGEEVEPDAPVVEPPHFWSKEEKEQFASLPADMQELVKAKFDDNERYINQQKMEVAEAKKSAAKEAEQLSAIAKRVEAAANAAESRFGDKWDGATPQWWADLAQKDPQKYTSLKAQYDADQFAIREATAARDATERLERERWVSEQAEQLKSLMPELFTPEGRKIGEDLKDYIKSNGASEDDLADLSAGAWVIAHKAMLYDRAKSAKPVTRKPAPTTIASKSAPPSRETVQQAERKAEQKRMESGTPAERRQAVVASLIRDGYA